ncbi:MAG: C39 family peptidase [candidate division WWE3 bacterium]|nr:C39 family peptidase [candidate division WWE3 bacterium]
MQQLKVPIYTQEKANTCGLAALRMILGYFGDNVSETELNKNIKLHSFGTFTTEIGLIPIKRGYRVTIEIFHLGIFGPLALPFRTVITSNIISNIKPNPRDKWTYESIKSFLKAGGLMIYNPPTIQIIENILKSKKPMLVNINTATLGKYKNVWSNGHFVVIQGFDSKNFTVLDPGRFVQKQSYEIDKNELVLASTINCAWSSGYLMSFSK